MSTTNSSLFQRSVILAILAIHILAGCASKKPYQLYKKDGLPPNFPLDQITDYQIRKVQLFNFDLNDDGKKEYFTQDNAGANKVIFLLTDSQGVSLKSQDIFCDSLFILKSKTNNYYNFLTVASTFSEPSVWLYWSFKNKKYHAIPTKKLAGDFFMCECHLYLENNIKAYWYIGEHGIKLN